MQQRHFRIPPRMLELEGSIVSRVIGSIPKQWSVIEGILFSPQWRRREGQIDQHTLWVFASHNDWLIEASSPSLNESPDVVGTLIGGKKPCGVEFGNEFSSCEVIPFNQAIQIAQHFTALDYHCHGDILNFQWTTVPRNTPILRCEICIPCRDLTGTSSDTRITVYYDDFLPQDGSVGFTVEPIIKKCQDLGLEEITRKQ